MQQQDTYSSQTGIPKLQIEASPKSDTARCDLSSTSSELRLLHSNQTKAKRKAVPAPMHLQHLCIMCLHV